LELEKAAEQGARHGVKIKRPWDSADGYGVPSDMAEMLKALERENRELRQANEILRKASAYFAQAELDRRFKP
jgi:transposase-like protein